MAADAGSPPGGDAVIATRDLTLSFGRQVILSGISTGVRRGAVTEAVRIADRTIFLNQGRMVEHGDTKQVFEHPGHEQTASCTGGRFG